MEEASNLFVEFQGVSKAEWLAKVEKDLKGKALADLNWYLEDDISLTPFFHKEDLKKANAPIFQAGWEIGEYIEVRDIKIANNQALEALKGGAEALGFKLHHKITKEGIAQLLKGIDLSLIATNIGEFYIDKNPLQLLKDFIEYAQDNEFDLATLKGSIDFDPLLDWVVPPMKDLVAAIQLVHEKIPSFKILQVNASMYHGGPKESTLELAYLAAKLNEYLFRLQEAGLDLNLMAQHLQVSVAISTSYFVEIAKLRAIRIIVNNIFTAYGMKKLPHFELVVHLAKESQTENVNTNMIRAATQALAAANGGADRIYVLPANYFMQEPSSTQSRRIARNVQHLLKLESYVDKVGDPGAGSYYIENLTNLLAGKAWEKFQELDAQKSFE